MEPIFESVDATGPCWKWTGTLNQGKYGYYSKTMFGTRLAHRIVWILLVGPLAKGVTLDHLCKNRACVNPDHLEPVTLAENKRRGASLAAINARKTHCKNGHPFNERSVRADGRGRRCRICEREHQRARQRALRG